MRAAKFKQISFDSAGSATVKFVGSPIEIGSHWRTETPAEALMCPKDLTGNRCLGCDANLMPRNRLVLLAWDIRKSKWSVAMMGTDSFMVLVAEMKKAGIDPDLLKTGSGPVFLVQRIKTERIEFSFLPMVETIGESIPEIPPSNEVLFSALTKQSIWSV